MAIKARLAGDGTEFVNGVPARSLTDDEFDALAPEQQRAVLETRDSRGRLLYAVREKTETVAEVAQAMAPAAEMPSSAPRGAKRGGA